MNMATATATEHSFGERRTYRGLCRAGILTSSIILSVAIVRTGLATALSKTNPLMAVQADSGSAEASAAAARALVEAGELPTSPRVRAFVRNALREDASLTPAIELRALDLDASGNRPAAIRLFELSRRISRRSLGTHMWLIQRAVDRRNVKDALAEYDLALRTSTAAPRLLFPVLSAAATNPDLAGPIARMLDRPSDWREAFLDYAIARQGTAPAMLTPLIVDMRDRTFLKDKQIDQMLIARLVGDGAFRPASSVAAAFGPALKPGALIRDSDFSQPQFRFPFGWELIENATVWAQRGQVSSGPVLLYHGASGGSGPAATQLLTLTPGRYGLSARSASPAIDQAARPYWTVTCASRPPRQIALIDLGGSANAFAQGDFAVPTGCDGQWLTLNLRASDRADGQSGAIRSVTIERRSSIDP